MVVVGCGKESSNGSTPTPQPTFTADNLSSQGHWIYGQWHLQGTPGSWGDLGADIRDIKITAQEVTYDIFGHLAAQSWSFNTDGYDFGGNCLFRVHSKSFGTIPSQSSTGCTLDVANPHYELIGDPGNRDDCQSKSTGSTR